jgi:hypothetical protein
MRRLFPFYSWARFNLPLQLEMMAKYPHRYLNLARTGRAIEVVRGGPDPNEEQWPAYLRDQLHVRLDYNPEADEYFVQPLQNWVPSAEIEKWSSPQQAGMSAAQMLTPFLKVPGEVLFNMDTLRSSGGKLTPIEKYPGEKETILGVPVRKKLGHVIKQARPVRIIESVRQELSKDQPKAAERVATRLVFGRGQVINPKQTSEYWWKRNKREYDEARTNLRYAYNDLKSKDPKKQAEATKNIPVLERQLAKLQAEARRQGQLERERRK